MNNVGRDIARMIGRSWAHIVRSVNVTREHWEVLVATLRELRETERQLCDALQSRVTTVEERLLPDAHVLLQEWDAIDNSSRSSEAKLLGLRALFVVVADRYARAAQRSDAVVDAAKHSQ